MLTLGPFCASFRGPSGAAVSSGVSVQREALVVQVTISKRLAIILLVLVALLVPAAAFAGSIFRRRRR